MLVCFHKSDLSVAVQFIAIFNDLAYFNNFDNFDASDAVISVADFYIYYGVSVLCGINDCTILFFCCCLISAFHFCQFVIV